MFQVGDIVRCVDPRLNGIEQGELCIVMHVRPGKSDHSRQIVKCRPLLRPDFKWDQPGNGWWSFRFEKVEDYPADNGGTNG